MKGQLKTPILVLGIVLLLGGMGLAVYGTSLPYQYSYQAAITDKTQLYTTYFLQVGNSTSWSQEVSSGSWMEINIISDNGGDVEITVTGSVSGQLYDLTGGSFYEMISFGKTETITVRILNPSFFNSVSILGTFTFKHWGIQTETRHQMEPLYLLSGGVVLCGGIGIVIYAVRSNKANKPSAISPLTTD